jgi:excinuclease ABC subunit A
VDTVMGLPAETRVMILAPVARERKGEFTELFADMQARGYVRFRIGATVYEYNDLPTLVKNEKHDIDVVIDRLRVREDARQRLAESFEAALRLAQGRAMALEMDGGQVRAALVLFQLAARRLPQLRRPGHARAL